MKCALSCTLTIHSVGNLCILVVQKLHKRYTLLVTNDTHVIRTYFAKLGLQAEIADMYLALHAHGSQTISELSRTSGVERTRIYRLIDDLLKSNLVEVETEYKRGIIKAAPIANLHILIAQREHELKSLQDELSLIEQVLGRNSLHSPASRIQFYRGTEGAKQMFWNQTKARDRNGICILYENMQIKTNAAFFDRWAKVCNENGIAYRGIVSDTFIENQEKWYATHTNERLQHWEQRHVSDDVFRVAHDTYVYDNVVSYFNRRHNEIFGIEIYNQEIADTQRQFFELLWQQAA